MAVDDEDEPRERLQISKTQIAASSAAAASAAVLCSFFGVAGTVIGTALASIVFTLASALYTYCLRRTKARLRRLHQAGASSPPFAEVVKTARQQGRRLVGKIPWRIAGAGAAIAFLVAIGAITVFESVAGRSISALFGVSHSGAHSSSLVSVIDPKHHKHKPKPTPTPSSTTPSPTATPTATVTKTVTAKPTPTRTPTKKPTPSHTPTQPPSITPTPTPTGAAS